MNDPKRKRSSTSSAGGNTSFESSPTTSKYFSKEDCSKTSKGNSKKKAKTEGEPGNMSIESKLDEINKTMNSMLDRMLTKDDRSFIRQVMCDMLEEMKDKLLDSVKKQISVLEGEVHNRAVENETLVKDIEQCRKENSQVMEENQRLRNDLRKEKCERERYFNDVEQYGRRNNIRITGIAHDRPNETAEETMSGVIHLLNKKLNLDLTFGDIDIAHRVGKYRQDKSRPVIVRLVQRARKAHIMKKKGMLKGTGMFINEDLTRLNLEVLSSLRLKCPDRVEKAWSYEGKLFVKYRAERDVRKIAYEHYSKWLSLPWPRRSSPTAVEIDK